MKCGKKALSLVLVVAMLLTCLTLGVSAIATDYVTISTNEIIGMAVGDTYRLTAIATVGKTIDWASSNQDVAYAEDGIIYAESVGECTVYAKVGSASAKCKVKVDYDEKISVVISVDTVNNMVPGDTYKLDGYSKAGNPIGWTSDNSAIATVDNNGVVTCKAFGSFDIYAVDTVTGEYSFCMFNEGENNYYYIPGFQVGQTYQLPAGYSWYNESSYDRCVSVTPEGLVTAVVPGGNYVWGERYTEEKGIESLEFFFEVVEKDNHSISVCNLDMLTGELYQLKANDSCTWSSSDESIATVANNGVICTINPGIAVISAEFADGTKIGCRVNIKGAGEKTLEILPGSITGIAYGDTYQLTVNKNFGTGDVVWNCNTSNMYIDDNNILHVFKQDFGFAVITATCEGTTAYCLVSELESEPDKNFDSSIYYISGFGVGETYAINVNELPQGCYVKLENCYGGNYISVEDNIITAKHPGTAFVYACVYDEDDNYIGKTNKIVISIADDGKYFRFVPSAISGIAKGDTYKVIYDTNIDKENLDIYAGGDVGYDLENVITVFGSNNSSLAAYYDGVFYGIMPIEVVKDSRDIALSVEHITGFCVGENYKVSAELNFTPENDYGWSVSGSSVVIEDGVITAVREGVSYLYYYADDIKAVCQIDVTDNRRITLSDYIINNLGVDETYKISWTTNFDTTGYELITSCDYGYADIDDDGVIYGYSAGNDMVYIGYYNPETDCIVWSDNCYVTIINVKDTPDVYIK